MLPAMPPCCCRDAAISPLQPKIAYDIFTRRRLIALDAAADSAAIAMLMLRAYAAMMLMRAAMLRVTPLPCC